MPMPKPETDEDGNITNLTVNGRPPKKLVKVVKVYEQDHPDVLNRLVELAAKKKAAEAAD